MVSERDAQFIEEALRLVEEGQKRGFIFRLLGSTAVKLHSPKFGYLYEHLDRPMTDIDIITYSKFRPHLKKFFIEQGYIPNEHIIAYYGRKRHIYWNEEKQLQADIFFDELDMCHKVDFRGRLELDYPTITLTDILLEKMQIVKINAKDIKDTIIMLREHGVGHEEKEMINLDYLTKVLSNDWGYYYTVTTNLRKVKGFLPEFEVLTEEDRRDVAGKIDTILEAIEAAPKGLKWKLRAKIGPKIKWYKEVEEVIR